MLTGSTNGSSPFFRSTLDSIKEGSKSRTPVAHGDGWDCSDDVLVFGSSALA